MRFQTMNSVRIQIVSLILAGLISMPAHGEVIPGRWEKVSALELGTPITVKLKNGDQAEGNFEGLSASDVDVETQSARAVIPKADIQTIATQKKGGTANGARKGAIIGAAAGAGVGAAGMMMTLANRDGNEDLGEAQGLFLLFVPAVATGIGTALGIFVWRRHQERCNRSLQSSRNSLESQAQRFARGRRKGPLWGRSTGAGE